MAKSKKSEGKKVGREKAQRKREWLGLLQRECLKEVVKEGGKWIWKHKEEIAEAIQSLFS